jgi:phosphatidylserine decarboxylase
MKRIYRLITSDFFQRVANKRMFSRMFGLLANFRFRPKRLERILEGFLKAYPVTLSDFELDNVRTFNDFFSRRLKPGARQFHGSVCSPADGFVSASGLMTESKLYQVKGKPYQLNDLLQQKPGFQTGSYFCIYLSLGDYHRVHLPFDATLRSIRRVPGTLYSLNPKTLERIDRVYCRNERVILEGESKLGRFYLILIGAIVVGKIRIHKNCILNAEIKQGTEVGHFEMGSTVLLVLESEVLGNLTCTKDTHLLTGEPLC